MNQKIEPHGGKSSVLLQQVCNSKIWYIHNHASTLDWLQLLQSCVIRSVNWWRTKAVRNPKTRNEHKMPCAKISVHFTVSPFP